VTEKKSLYVSPGELGKRGFEDLDCYKLALEVMVNVHAFSKTLPPDEKFGLYAQIRRSAKGITGNIGEGYGRYHYLDSLRFYSITRGELNETLAYLIDAKVLEYINQLEFELLYKIIRQTEQALNGFMSYVRRQRAGSQEYGDRPLHESQASYYIVEDDEDGNKQE